MAEMSKPEGILLNYSTSQHSWLSWKIIISSKLSLRMKLIKGISTCKTGLACEMYHSCRIWVDLYPSRLRGTGYYQHKSIVQNIQNHDFLWLLPSVTCVLAQLPITVQNSNKKGMSQYNFKQSEIVSYILKSKQNLISMNKIPSEFYGVGEGE